jgi:DNA-binding winged helix-turn-helix (wHTH) protein
MERNGGQTLDVGGWTFFPATCELRRGDVVRRVEPRAARALELLCEADGGMVSQEEFVAKVWDGRALSENSLSVVIGQLRRALDDDAREPRIVETIPKRGYRLRAKAEANSPSAVVAPRKRLWTALVPILLLLVIGAWAWTAGQSAGRLMIDVRDVANETGDGRYAPLARATSELIVTKLDARGFAVRRGGPGDLLLQSKLIIWDDKPFVSMAATDRDGTVRWSAMLNASPGRVPPNVDKAFDDLERRFPAEDGAERLAKAGARR